MSTTRKAPPQTAASRELKRKRDREAQRARRQRRDDHAKSLEQEISRLRERLLAVMRVLSMPKDTGTWVFSASLSFP